MKEKLYYHFTDGRLRDGRPLPEVGEWLEHKGPLEPCRSGLHASEHPFDALSKAPGIWLHVVELDGEVIQHGIPVDKVVARKRKIVATIDATELLRKFARRCALDVLPLWKDAPEIVKRYLETGDESIRAAARDAAKAAARDAAKAAARDAAKAAEWAAEWDAEWAAEWDAARAAAKAAAWAAARDAVLIKYRGWFKEMVDEAFNEQRKEAK